MAVVSTVVLSAICTIVALLSMFVFGVSVWTILLIYGGFCAAIALVGAAVFIGMQKSGRAIHHAGGNFSDDHLGNFDGQLAVNEP
ncbi:MAG: hypothetical protein ABJI96_18650 [Paracoccaceae bacterium]